MNKTDLAQKIVGSNGNRKKDDFYPTPSYCTYDLLNREKFFGDIWEPACGDGAISKVLELNGHAVYSTDLVYRGYGQGGVDFFLTNQRHGNIITNPPYRMAKEFVDKALMSADSKVAMLLKLVFLEGEGRKHWFQLTPLKTVYVYSKRVNFDQEQKSGMLAFAWFVWEHGYTGKPMIEWI